MLKNPFHYQPTVVYLARHILLRRTLKQSDKKIDSKLEFSMENDNILEMNNFCLKIMRRSPQGRLILISNKAIEKLLNCVTTVCNA